MDFYTFIPSNPLVWVLYILLSWRLYQGLSFDIRHSFTETFIVIKCGAFRRDTNIMRWYCLRYLGLILSQILGFDIVSDTWVLYCLRYLGLILSQILGFDIVSDTWVWYCHRYLRLILSQILGLDIVSDTWAWYCLRFLGFYYW